MLEVKNLTKIYRPKKGIPVKALDNVNLNIEDKGMVFILGKSGSGKSTLLNLLGGLDKYDAGEIIIKGKSSKNFTQADFDSYRNTYLGFIFQEYNILNEFTVGANIALAMELQGKKADNQELNNLLKQVDLEGLANRKPNELSGGQKQRIAIARALIKNPEIILADEPTGALDSKTGKQVFETLQKLSKDKLVLIVSHDREFAEFYGDRVIEMADGKVISDIKKHKKISQKMNGISIIDDKILHIKKGYELTSEDMALINDYLKKNKSDTFISMDTKTNIDMKKMARIDDSGNRDAFKATKPEDIITKDYSKSPFKLIKSKLSLGKSIKIGASALTHKKIKLVVSILITVCALTLFGLTDTLASYNISKTFATSARKCDLDFLSITNYDNYDEKSFEEYAKKIISNTDIKDYSRGYENHILLLNGNRYNYDIKETNLQNLIYASYDHNIPIVEVNSEQIKNYGTLKGRYPKKYDEIIITDYLFNYFKINGISDNQYSEDKIYLKTPEDLFNHKFKLNNNYGQPIEFVKIVGILDTGFDKDKKFENKFKEVLNAPKTNDLTNLLFEYSYKDYRKNSKHLMYYAMPGTMDKLESHDNPLETSVLLAPMPSSNKEIRNIAKYVFSQKTEFNYGPDITINSEFSNMLTSCDSFADEFTQIFLYIGIGVAIFASLIMSSFIANSISYKKREIGILRAIGARGFDVFKIFGSESIIIALINAILAIIATWGSSIAINNSMARDIPITIFNFGFRQGLLIIGISILVALIASFLPVKHVARKKPIDAIRNR